MKRVDTIARVRRAFHVLGWSVKRIARELHVSRVEAIAPLMGWGAPAPGIAMCHIGCQCGPP